MRRRTKAREIALQFLYQLDLRGETAMENLAEHLSYATKDRDVQEFSLRLISGTKDLRPELDEMLQRVAKNWDLRRMACLDRNILRMAIFEILYCSDIPPNVSINEAIDMGKKFSTANSGAFINGILDRVKSESDQQSIEKKSAMIEIRSPDGELPEAIDLAEDNEA